MVTNQAGLRDNATSRRAAMNGKRNDVGKLVRFGQVAPWWLGSAKVATFSGSREGSR